MDIGLDGFNLFRADRKGKGGGVAIYVRLCFQISVLVSVTVPKEYECLVLSVNLGENSQVTVIGAYRPPSAPPCAIDNLVDIFSSFTASEMLIMGDFNLDWDKPISDSLKDMCTNLNLTQLITKPTRPNAQCSSRSSLIDIILTNMPQRYASSGVFPQDVSDHCPIACIRNVKLRRTKPRIISKRNFRNFDAQEFLHDLNVGDLNRVFLINDPDLALAYFRQQF